MPKVRARIIINPIAGTRSKQDIPMLIDNLIDSERFQFEVIYTKRAGHATALAVEAVDDKCDLVIAVGGDGTINEVAQGLLNTTTALGLIPMGSGNGLARHLGVPLVPAQAISYLNNAQYYHIDVGTVNSKMFLCTAGFGLDALVSHRFAEAPKRGFFTYAKIAFKNFVHSKNQEWKLIIDGINRDVKGFLLTVANANQYGNNVFIAPKAQLQDGLLDTCVMQKVPLMKVPLILRQMFTKKLHLSKYYSTFQGEDILIKNTNEIQAHIDGEPVFFEGDINIKVLKKALKIFTQ